MPTDPVCGQSIDPLRARAVAIVAGERYYFCSVEHRERFAADPPRYVAALRPEPEIVLATTSPLPIAPPAAPAHLVRFEIGGMAGAEDGERVRRAIARVAGVEDVVVDRVTDVATVAIAPEGFRASALVEAVATAGFEAAPRATRTRRGAGADVLVAAAGVAAVVATIGGGWAYVVGPLALAGIAWLGWKLERRVRGVAQAEVGALEPLPEVAVGPGDLVRVAAPELVLVDGVVRSGEAEVDETAIGGASDAQRDAGDPVVAGTRVARGELVVEVRRAGAERTLDRLRAAVVELARSPSPTVQLSSALERWALPVALAAAALLLGIALRSGRGLGAAAGAAAAALVALGPLPVALAVSPGVAIAGARAARRGVLFRNAEALERAASVRVIVLDRGATLAGGRREIEGVAVVDGEIDERQLVALAAAVEGGREGPLARALRARAEELGVHVPPVEDVISTAGRGVTATVAGKAVAVGSRRLAEAEGAGPAELDALAARLGGRASAVYVLVDRKLAGVVGVAIQVLPGARDVVASLQARGVRVALVTGDEAAAAAALATDAGITEVRAGLPPDAKKRVVAGLRAHGPVAVVGDSVDDAAALAAADVGIAVARGAAVELAAGGITVLRGDLDGVVVALDLARRTAWTIRVGLGLACVHAALAATLLALAPLGPIALPLCCATTGAVLGAIVLGAERLRRW